MIAVAIRQRFWRSVPSITWRLRDHGVSKQYDIGLGGIGGFWGPLHYIYQDLMLVNGAIGLDRITGIGTLEVCKHANLYGICIYGLLAFTGSHFNGGCV